MSCEYVAQRAAANLPQSTFGTLFTVSGGNVLLLGLVGTVTVGIQAQPNTATVSVDQATILFSPNIGGFAVGDLIASGLGDGNRTANLGFASQSGYILASGAAIVLSCGASSTGQVRWTLLYKPLDAGALVS